MERNILDFMNNASFSELLTLNSVRQKKASIVLELRPFKDWFDLCNKLNSQKPLFSDLLKYVEEHVKKQKNVNNILDKCNTLRHRLEYSLKYGAPIVEQPQLLNSNLKLTDYQMIGLNWLIQLLNLNMNSILADEMGLGKTIQIIAFLAYLKEENLNKGAHLIVVPSSTLNNWENELHNWCPSLVVEKYYGNQLERHKMRLRYKRQAYKGFDILLTTYSIVSSTSKDRQLFQNCKLHYVIFDEAHILKNMMTLRYTKLVTIKAKNRILLTGTPFQNNLTELMSLLSFVLPDFFVNKIDDVKSLLSMRNKAEDTAEKCSEFQDSQIEQAKLIMKPFILHRLKKDVLKHLPQKTTHMIKITMTKKQMTYYQDLFEYYAKNKNEIQWNEKFSIGMNMRKIANHPLLERHYFTDSDLHKFSKRLAKIPAYKKTNPQHIFEDLAILSDFKVWQLCHKYELNDVCIPFALILDSGKFKYLDEILPKLKQEGHRVLLFTQFTMMLDIMEQYMALRCFKYCRLDGSTVVDKRQDLINKFNNDEHIFIFLLSTRAGGVGINLTAADTCIIHDMDFNPYNDRQAENRCHRLGQTRPVTIYKLLTKNTVEENIATIADGKLKIGNEVTELVNQNQEQRSISELINMSLRLNM